MKKFLQRCKTWAPWVVLLALLWAMAVPRGWAASTDVSYNIMNGDFQNYNPVRRLLAGQAPYKDFAVYLGAGELYSVGAVLLCIGNSFANSVFSAAALTWFFYELLVLAVGIAVLGRGRQARAFALAVSGWNFLALIGTSVPFAGFITQFLGISGYVGNSARMIRFSALTLLVLTVAAGLHLWQAKGERPLFGGAVTLPQKLRAALRWPLHPAVLVPLAAGALVPWSNDAGGAAYIAASLGYGLFLIRIYKKDLAAILRGTLGYIAVSVVGLGLSVTVVSWGHPLAWWRQTRGVSSMQTWYYGSDPAAKLCYITDFIPSRWFFLMLGLSVLFGAAVLLARERRAAVQAAGCLTLCLGAALWEFLYAVGSGVLTGTDAGGQMVLGLLIPAALALALRQLASRMPLPRPAAGRAVETAAAALACAAAFIGVRAQLADTALARQTLTYQPELGGWLGDQAEKLDRERTLLDGQAVFSTYAGGVEAVTGQFQPTGVDYIIHAMGDRQRLNYLLAFQNGDFTYAATPSPKVVTYERWARNANWFFYRDLYRFWQPMGSTTFCGGMHLFWQRSADGNLGQPTAVTLEQVSASEVVLTVTAEDPSFNGVADVTLDYSLETGATFRLRGGLHTYLHAECVTENALWADRGKEGSADFFLPADRTTWQLPVTIADGKGTVVLTGWPQAETVLTVNAATVNATTIDWEYFFE